MERVTQAISGARIWVGISFGRRSSIADMQVLVISWLSNPSTAEHIDESMHYIRSAAQINAAEAYLVHIEKLPKHLSEYSSRVEANFLVVLFPKSTSLRS